MIVYTGKQFGNNFNNGDEALFQDANRPRDNDKFKIRPGLQSDKWKQREVNKDITTIAAQLVATCVTDNVSASTALPETATIPFLKEEERTGNPGCIVNNEGNIEIVEDGTYIIQALTRFIPPTIPVNGYIYTEAVGLLRHKTGNYTGFERETITSNQARLVGRGDELMARWAGRFTKGAILNVGAIHNYGSAMTLKQRMNIQRLA